MEKIFEQIKSFFKDTQDFIDKNPNISLGELMDHNTKSESALIEKLKSMTDEVHKSKDKRFLEGTIEFFKRTSITAVFSGDLDPFKGLEKDKQIDAEYQKAYVESISSNFEDEKSAVKWILATKKALEEHGVGISNNDNLPNESQKKHKIHQKQ